MVVREGRQDGRRTRLHSDAGRRGQADRKDLVRRDQELRSRAPEAVQRCFSGAPRRRDRLFANKQEISPGSARPALRCIRGRRRTRQNQVKVQGIGVAEMAVQSDVMEAEAAAGPYDRARALSAFKLGDVTFYWLTRACAISVLLILGGIILSLIVGAWPALR